MRKVLIIMLMILFSTYALIATTPLSIEESIDLALDNNKELLAVESGYEAAHWSQYNMLSNFFPQAYFNATAVRIDDKTYERATEMFKIPVFGPNNLPTGDYIPFSAGAMNGIYRTTYRSNLTVQQPIFTGGKILLGYQMSRLARKQAGNSLEHQKNEISHQTADLYFNILRLSDLRETVNRNIRAAEANLSRIMQMKEQGMARQSDVLQWQVKFQEYGTVERELDYNVQMLLELWNNLLGFSEVYYHPVTIDLESYDEIISHYSSITNEGLASRLEENVSALQEYNPQMQNLDLTREMVSKNYTMAKGNFLPTLNLQFTYELEHDDKLDLSGDRNWNIAAVLSMPLFRGGANYTALRKTRAEKRQVELSTSAFEDFMITETRRLTRQLVTEAFRVESNKAALELTRENYSILHNLFEQGLVTSTELLDAETMLFAGESNLIAAYYDFVITMYELNKYTTSRGDK